MSTTIIVACDKNNVIGVKGKLPWRIPEDLKLFKQATIGSPVIMGRITWESLPKDKKPLEKRANIVISRTSFFSPIDPLCGPFHFFSLKMALDEIKKWENYQYLQQYHGKDTFIIGGAQIYKTALDEDLVDKIIMSKIDGQYEGDVYFPKLDPKWTCVRSSGYNGFVVLEWIKKENP